MPKSNSIIVGDGIPQSRDGNNGDITIRHIKGSGVYLFVKAKNRWYSRQFLSGKGKFSNVREANLNNSISTGTLSIYDSRSGKYLPVETDEAFNITFDGKKGNLTVYGYLPLVASNNFSEMITEEKNSAINAATDWIAYSPSTSITLADQGVSNSRLGIRGTSDLAEEGVELPIAELGALTVGKTYTVTAELISSSGTLDDFHLYLGGVESAAFSVTTTNGIFYQDTITIINNTDNLRIYNKNDFASWWYIHNVSVKEVVKSESNLATNVYSASDAASGTRTVSFRHNDTPFFSCESSTQSTKAYFYERGGRYGADDYLTFSVFEHGATTFQTIDAAANNADLQFYADGEVQFRSTKNDFNFKDVDGFTSIAMNTDFQSEAGEYFYFTYTGHVTGEEDIWESGSAHGLKVGDRVLSDDSLNGVPTEYADVENPRDFYVVNVPTTTTMQLSTTLGGSVLEGSADSGSGNPNKWMFKKYNTLIQPTGDVQIDAGGSITLDSTTGVFVSKKAGTEFSVANSAYAGMILGYTTVGKNAAPDSKDVTTAMLPVHDDLKVTFKAPPSGAVEIFVSITVDSSQATRSLELGLSTTDTSSFTSLDAQYENMSYLSSGSESMQHTHRWVVTGLTPNAVDTYWLAASSEAGRIDVRWGGSASSTGDTLEPYEYQPFIMKATALPEATTDYAVYD